jgi:flavin reductase (DIM6/NTAB) family NADH-FMN oxidoreductase RutF
MTAIEPGATPHKCVDPMLMRNVMSRFATGVAVVATIDDGMPYAAAVNSLTSVSLEPPLILVCLQLHSRTGAAIQRRGAFSVSVLADTHEEYSRRFARMQPAAGDLELVDGLPVVTGCVAGMICETESMQQKGDHVIFIGQVVRTHQGEGMPLLFFGSKYHRLGQMTLQPGGEPVQTEVDPAV